MDLKKSLRLFKGLLFLTVVLVFGFNSLLISNENESSDNKALLISLSTTNSTVEVDSFTLTTKSDVSSDFSQIASSEFNPYSARYFIPEKQEKPSINLRNFPVRRVNKKRGTEDSLFASTLVSLTALNAVDFYTTNKALKIDGLEEANPLMKPFTKNTYVFAAAKLGLTALNCYTLNKVHKNNKTLGWFLSITSNIVLTYIVYNNTKLIQRFQR